MGEKQLWVCVHYNSVQREWKFLSKVFYHENSNSEMNIIKLTNTSGFCNKAVLLPLAAVLCLTLSGQYKSFGWAWLWYHSCTIHVIVSCCIFVYQSCYIADVDTIIILSSSITQQVLCHSVRITVYFTMSFFLNRILENSQVNTVNVEMPIIDFPYKIKTSG